MTSYLQSHRQWMRMWKVCKATKEPLKGGSMLHMRIAFIESVSKFLKNWGHGRQRYTFINHVIIRFFVCVIAPSFYPVHLSNSFATFLGTHTKSSSFCVGPSTVRNAGSHYVLSINGYKAHKRTNDISTCTRVECGAFKSCKYCN